MTDRTHEPSPTGHETARLSKSSSTDTEVAAMVAELTADNFHQAADLLTRLAEDKARLEGELAKAREWSPNDREDQWTAAIRAAHPMNSDDPKRHDHFDTAMDMVGARRSKFALVELVSWLIARADKAESDLSSLKAALVSVRDWDSLYDAFPHALAMQVRDALGDRT